MYKKKLTTRICSIVLTALLILGIIPQTVFAENENTPTVTGGDIINSESLGDNTKEEPLITFLVEPNEPLYLNEGQKITNVDLLAGVTAEDENGESVEVTVQSVGGLDLVTPMPNQDFSAYTITYGAEHPVSKEVFTLTREAYVTVETMMLASTADVIDLSDSDADLSNAAAASGGKYSYDAGTKVVTVNSGPVTVTGSTTDKKVVVTANSNITLQDTSIQVNEESNCNG